MTWMRRLALSTCLAVFLLVGTPVTGATEASALAPPEMDCRAWYVGSANDEEWYYFECRDEDGAYYSGWLIFPA